MLRYEKLPRILTAARAESAGISVGRRRTEIRRGNWQRLAAGITLTDPHTPTREDWAEVGMLLAGTKASAVSGWDALRHHDIVRGSPPATPVLVVTTERRRNRTVGGVHIRATARSFASSWASGRRAIKYTGPARAVADYALSTDDARLVRDAVTTAVQRRKCTLPELLAELAACPRNGSHWFRAALKDAVGGARSVAEAEALQALTDARVPSFEMNVEVHNEFGELIFILDFLWRELRALLEIDSREFHLDEEGWLRTMAKHSAMTRVHFAVEHAAPSVMRADGWADEINSWLRGRAKELGVTLRPGHGAIPLLPGQAPPPLVIPGLRKTRAASR